MDERHDRDELRRQWRQLAPGWVREMREGRNAPRAGMLDGAMLEACGPVAGLQVLDSGCGEGRFARMLAAAGARRVLGLDACEAMIDAARQLACGPDEYRVADVEDLSFLPDASFDLAVSCLNQCDLPDFAANTRALFRVLRPGGRFVVANVHPMRSAVGAWQRDAGGAKQHVILDNYFDESQRRWKMLGVEITNFHRTLGTYLNAYLDAGFALCRLIEPTVTDEALKAYPENDDEQRVPNFIIFVLAKPEQGLGRRGARPAPCPSRRD
ncbi:MAG: Ubiquinone/menaquinone biosynthesis C-methyltransferase UbiE [Phycisphaerae bacterium]|nr:Ubiquinone/menaquinone biosynthesis C-methyltransferase UbiE [Phycisphaerae bacterium]